MAGEIQLNSTTMATESSGSITAELDTIRPNTTNGSLTLQGDSSDAGVTGLTIDSSGVVNTTTAKVTNIQATSGQSLTIKDEDGNTAITIGTDNTAAGYLSLIFGSYHGDSGGAGSGTLTGNTLDDYEEGSYTTGLNDSSGNETTGTVTGYYTKVGNLCFCGFESFNNINTTGLTSSDIACFKLPFTSTSRAGAHTLRTDNLTWATGSGSITGAVEGNLFKLRRSTSGQSDAAILVSNFTSGTTDIVDFALIYTVS
jgi:hypothetical protein